jgi:hypothetical protein
MVDAARHDALRASGGGREARAVSSVSQLVEGFVLTFL